MDFSLSKSDISNIMNVCDSNISQSVDSDITLPEYVDDIDCVLSCALTPQIDSAVFSEGRVTVEGRATVRLLYTSQKGTLNCFENEIPFSRFADMQNATETDCISALASTQYVNCRLVNPRRFDVHGNIVVSLKALRVHNEQVVSSAQGCGIQTLKKAITISNAKAINEKSFSLSEVLEINGDLPSIAQIVSINASPSVTDTKLISGKALIKGDMDLDVFFIPDNQPNSIEKARFTLPISQIVELDSADEGDSSVSEISVSYINYTVRADSGGSIRLIDISVGARAKVSVFKTEETEVVFDAYSTEFEIENEIKRIETRCLKEQFADSCLCRCPFSVSGKEINAVTSLMTRDIVSECSRRDGKLVISGSVRAGLTVEFSNGEKGYIEKPIEFEYSRPVDCEEIICEKSVRVNASSFVLNSNGNADVRVETEITGWIFEKKCLPLITDICVKEENKKSPCPAALTLYYPDKCEPVWEIAKKYNTTVSAITRENQLSDDEISPGTMLILPRI